MTTRTILTDLRAYIDDLIPGYAVKYFRWTDADETSEGPFVMMRFPGVAIATRCYSELTFC